MPLDDGLVRALKKLAHPSGLSAFAMPGDSPIGRVLTGTLAELAAGGFEA